jgi:hypothetical protein
VSVSWLLALLGIAALPLAFAGSADAAPSKAELGKFCATAGTGAGQCKTLRGVAVNQTGAGGAEAGAVYVADGGNNRVDVFSATGAFIRAFGKEVDQTTGGNVCVASCGWTVSGVDCR